MGFVYKNFKQIMLVTILLLCSGCVSNAAISQNIDTSCKSGACSWEQSKEILQQFVKEGSCERYWNIIWPHAKSGNLEARAYLFSLMASPPDMNFVYAPGSGNNYISRMYHLTVLAVHTFSYNGKKKWGSYHEIANELYKQVGFNQVTTGHNFLQCLKTQSKDCSKIAVSDGLVPSFESYATSIDVLLSKGMRSTCSNLSTVKEAK